MLGDRGLDLADGSGDLDKHLPGLRVSTGSVEDLQGAHTRGGPSGVLLARGTRAGSRNRRLAAHIGGAPGISLRVVVGQRRSVLSTGSLPRFEHGG